MQKKRGIAKDNNAYYTIIRRNKDEYLLIKYIFQPFHKLMYGVHMKVRTFETLEKVCEKEFKSFLNEFSREESDLELILIEINE